MIRLYYWASLVVLALVPVFTACSDATATDKTDTTQFRGEQPQYIQKALLRAAQLSTNPERVVGLCQLDGRKLGHSGDALADYVRQCVENTGME